jgi:hypothetical protein
MVSGSFAFELATSAAGRQAPTASVSTQILLPGELLIRLRGPGIGTVPTPVSGTRESYAAVLLDATGTFSRSNVTIHSKGLLADFVSRQIESAALCLYSAQVLPNLLISVL